MYLNLLDNGLIILLNIYTKNEKENLSQREIKQLRGQKMKNDAISKALKKATKDWNIEEVVQAVIDDECEVEQMY